MGLMTLVMGDSHFLERVGSGRTAPDQLTQKLPPFAPRGGI